MESSFNSIEIKLIILKCVLLKKIHKNIGGVRKWQSINWNHRQVVESSITNNIRIIKSKEYKVILNLALGGVW